MSGDELPVILIQAKQVHCLRQREIAVFHHLSHIVKQCLCTAFLTALVDQFFHDAAHTAHSFFCTLILRDFVSQDLTVHILWVHTREIVHQSTDPVPAPIGPVDIEDMGTVLKRPGQFPDHPLYMIKRASAVKIVVLRDEDDVGFRQLLIAVARLGGVGIQHGAVVARPLRQRSGVAALHFDVVDASGGVVGGDVQPDRLATQILQGILGVHLDHHKAVVVQDGTNQEFRASLILEHLAHERIVHQPELSDLGQEFPILLIKRLCVHPHLHHILSSPPFLLYYEAALKSTDSPELGQQHLGEHPVDGGVEVHGLEQAQQFQGAAALRPSRVQA